MKGPDVLKEPVPRRTFLAYLVGGVTAFLAAVLGLLGLGTVLSPATVQEKSKGTWTSVGKVGEFKPGVPKKVNLVLPQRDGWLEASKATSVWVVRREQESDFWVYNPRCTHLGCAYSWKTEGSHEDHFFCPCHDGVYDLDGTVLGGPPPRRLDTLPFKVENGELLVQYTDFQVGIPRKLALS